MQKTNKPLGGVFGHTSGNAYKPSKGSALDKLGYLASPPLKSPQNGPKPLYSETFEKRAKPKHKSTYIGLNLALANENSPMVKRYWRQFRCSSSIELDQATGKTRTKYCDTRTCQVCGRIRTAKMINQYGPILDQTPNLYFVTLTDVTVPGPDLRATIKNRIKKFGDAIKNLKQNKRRAKVDSRINCIRKLELTYNFHTKQHHPHIHALIEGEQNAKDLLCYWMNHTPTASWDAQNIKPADSGSYIELFKYITKTTTKDKQTGIERVNPYRITDIQIQALDRVRTFAVYGFEQPHPENHQTDNEETLSDVEPKGGLPLRFEYIPFGLNWNWYELETGEPLTRYDATKVSETLRPPDG
jgi:plasmid rolling circle replication initiator protein Rep